MGISAVAQGEPASIKTFLIGFLLSDTFWTLELSFLHEGLKQKEWSLENITAVKTRIELGLLRTALTLVLIVVYITPGGLANVLFLSCAVSVIGLLLWIDFMFFRHTHYLLSDPDEMWSSGHRQLINESRTMARRPFPDIIRAAICLVLLGFCTDSLIRSLTRQPPLIRYFLALFVVPLVTRVSMQYWFVRRERLHSTDSLMNHTLEAMVSTALITAPCLVILGWSIKVPMTLYISLVETTILSTLVICIMSYQLRNGRSTYLSSVSLVLAYFMMALGMCSALNGEYG